MKSQIKVYDLKLVFDMAVVKIILSTDDLQKAIDTVISEFGNNTTLTFKHSFATERKMAKILKIHSVTVVCPECNFSNYIPDMSVVDKDTAGIVTLFCEKCKERYFLSMVGTDG